MRRGHLFLLTVILSALPGIAHACSICFYGDTDTPVNRGLRWGVLTLLAALFCIMGIFVYFLVRFKQRAKLSIGES